MPAKNLELDRLVFFSDAVVAIAITLLALDLKLPSPAGDHLRYADLLSGWHRYIAFLLSFIIIAAFWKVHHEFFFHITRIDSTLLWYNVWWLLFIVMLPFTTTLISNYFSDAPAMVVYSVNVLCITIFQNQLWDHVAVRPGYVKDSTGAATVRDFRIACNVAMVNALVAVVISVFFPLAGFIVLFLRVPMLAVAKKIWS